MPSRRRLPSRSLSALRARSVSRRSRLACGPGARSTRSHPTRASTPSGSPASPIPCSPSGPRWCVPFGGRRSRSRDSGRSAQPIGEAVYRNLADKGVSGTEDELDEGWSARQLVDGTWLVRFTYRSRGRNQVAEWALDEQAGAVTARDRLATQLAYRSPPRRRHSRGRFRRARARWWGGPPGRRPAQGRHGAAGRRGQGRVEARCRRSRRAQQARAKEERDKAAKAAAARKARAQAAAQVEGCHRGQARRRSEPRPSAPPRRRPRRLRPEGRGKRPAAKKATPPKRGQQTARRRHRSRSERRQPGRHRSRRRRRSGSGATAAKKTAPVKRTRVKRTGPPRRRRSEQRHRSGLPRHEADGHDCDWRSSSRWWPTSESHASASPERIRRPARPIDRPWHPTAATVGRDPTTPLPRCAMWRSPHQPTRSRRSWSGAARRSP